jgi:hypothetical protein
MSVEPLDIDLARPRTRLQPTTIREVHGAETPLPRYEKHLLCDAADGLYPEQLNAWEAGVVTAELRGGALAWYRNPSRASPDLLGVADGPGNAQQIMRPDFLFFSRSTDGEIVADVVDPHGLLFEDALPKLKGLAEFAASERGRAFRRIEAIAKVNETYRVLDLKEPSVRESVSRALAVKALYDSAATGYLV